MLEYHPRNHYVNDFTVIKKGDIFHLFHITGKRLKMSRSLTDLPFEGHAVSKNLIHWKEEPFVTQVTGGACSCVKYKGKYALIRNLNCIHWSKDLYTWSEPEEIFFDFEKHKDIYETTSDKCKAMYNSHRDPNIWWDKEKKRYIMFFCSRVCYGNMFTRGCVGAAESHDLIHWKILPPAYGPGDHFFPESPHVIDLAGKYHMFFSLSPENGLRHAVSEKLTGPYEEVEKLDILPAYVTASEAIKVNAKWLFLGRLEDRNERCNQTRLAPRALCLPLEIKPRPDNSIYFTACHELETLRGKTIFDSKRHKLLEHWAVRSGDWRIITKADRAANEHQKIPPNSLFGSGNMTTATIFLNIPVHNFDMEFSLQLPTFNGNDVQARGGIILDGILITIDALLKAVFCQDNRDILAFKNVPLFKNDRYYHFRLFRCEGIMQIYMNSELLMYLPAYGNGSNNIGFMVDHSDMIIKDIHIWKLDIIDQKGFTLDNTQGEIVNGIYF